MHSAKTYYPSKHSLTVYKHKLSQNTCNAACIVQMSITYKVKCIFCVLMATKTGLTSHNNATGILCKTNLNDLISVFKQFHCGQILTINWKDNFYYKFTEIIQKFMEELNSNNLAMRMIF